MDINNLAKATMLAEQYDRPNSLNQDAELQLGGCGTLRHIRITPSQNPELWKVIKETISLELKRIEKEIEEL